MSFFYGHLVISYIVHFLYLVSHPLAGSVLKMDELSVGKEALVCVT